MTLPAHVCGCMRWSCKNNVLKNWAFCTLRKYVCSMLRRCTPQILTILRLGIPQYLVCVWPRGSSAATTSFSRLQTDMCLFSLRPPNWKHENLMEERRWIIGRTRRHALGLNWAFLLLRPRMQGLFPFTRRGWAFVDCSGAWVTCPGFRRLIGVRHVSGRTVGKRHSGGSYWK